ncbi:thioredoxin domain-containing protein 6 [Eucyclogobius newberryi]|uniref:thioredoxin domain-containing protein 6 n=1 Tax=Eucyclogobius newberryi TaxID=166745 RepID=UPI003B5A4781
MAGKKKEGSLQVSLTNQEQWEEMLATKGLTVVDVYQQWCGPCRAVISLLRKIKNELGDDLLHFATAEADSIDALERYRGKCEPTFLFYGGGELVAVLRGANAPLLQKIIVEELAKEKAVLEQGGERRVIKDEGLVEDKEEPTTQSEDEENIIVPASKSCTVAILKPDAVAHGKANEIIMKIQDAGFEILVHEERTLTEIEARDFYPHKAQEPWFEDLVQFMCSGPSHMLLLSQPDSSANTVRAWLDFIGPADIEEARRDKPESLRAQYGTQTLYNAVHGSEDSDRASRELASLFPNFRTATATEQDEKEEPVERTLALIRPEVARESRDEILNRILKAGFTVALQREVTLTEEQVRQFYAQHGNESYFPALLKTMTSGPVLALALAKVEAVQHWNHMLGPSDVAQAKVENPECLRAQFFVEGELISPLHGSASIEQAQQEINLFFPRQHTLAMIKPDAVEEHKDEILEKIHSKGFAIKNTQETFLSKEVAEEFYKEHKEMPFFSQLVHFICSGPCLLLVLSKENAVEEWRAVMGPTDPDKAKEISPDSLRARFASDILHNAVHGSSSAEQADREIQLMFGDHSTEQVTSSEGETDGFVFVKEQSNTTDEDAGLSSSSGQMSDHQFDALPPDLHLYSTETETQESDDPEQ